MDFVNRQTRIVINKEGCGVLQIWMCMPRLLPSFYAALAHLSSVHASEGWGSHYDPPQVVVIRLIATTA